MHVSSLRATIKTIKRAHSKINIKENSQGGTENNSSGWRGGDDVKNLAMFITDIKY